VRRPRRGPGPARGFTLIELLVGSAVVLVILTGAAAVLLAASSQHRRALEKANLERASMLLIGQMQAELRQVGLGVPKGSSSSGDRFPASIFVANPGEIAFIADLARPNSSFNGVSQLSDDQAILGVGLSASGVAILNELNGTCAVDVLSPHCLTNQTSALFAAGPDCTANQGAPTCPWGLRKYQLQEWLIMANGAGNWLERRLPMTGNVFGSFASRYYLAVPAGRPLGFFSNLPNRGFVSTPDRVFYRLNAGTVERQQCWESISEAPTVGSLSGPLGTPCTTEGTGWEPRARGVSTLAFEYRDGADTVIPAPVAAADLRRIRRVVITLSLQRAVGTATVTADAVTSATVRL